MGRLSAGGRPRAALFETQIAAWRKAIDAAAMPGALGGYRRRARGQLSQADMAYLLGVSEKTYREFETLKRSPHRSLVDRFALVAGLSAADHAALCLLTMGLEPPPRPSPSGGQDTGVLQLMVDALPWPSYVSDQSWDLVVCNQALLDWFPGMDRSANLMECVLTDEAARDQLYEWERDWASHMLAQLHWMRLRLAKSGLADPRVDEVLARCSDHDETTRRLVRQLDVRWHSDGQRRALWSPDRRALLVVHIQASTPLAHQTWRCVSLIPLNTTQVDPRDRSAWPRLSPAAVP
jgi:transcriptional regulator with XRE-family HTH domain